MRHLNDEILAVESRISHRRAALPRMARDARASALHALASPAGLAAAVALGFLAGGGVRRRRHHKGDGAKATKASGLLGLAMSGAMWFVRAKFGSPMGLAHAVLEKIQAAKRSDASSGARRHAATGGAALTSR